MVEEKRKILSRLVIKTFSLLFLKNQGYNSPDMQANFRIKKRNELPGVQKLKISFDIDRLRESLSQMEGMSAWDGLQSEYKSLCEVFDQLPPFFMEESCTDGSSTTYQQLALTEFDNTFSLDKRVEPSGTFWDKTSPHRNPKADERFYRKPLTAVPEYLMSVLGHFAPHVHRARFAKLAPGHQVKPHIDYDTTYSVRLHIPIITDERCKLGVEYQDKTREEIHLPADGSVYFVNQGLLHWATNPSDIHRVHLILSIDSQRFLV